MFVFLAIASFLAVVVHQESWLKIDPSILGLALSMLIQLTALFQWTVRQSAEVVNHFVAVERVVAFRDLPPESALTNDFDESLIEWPAKGEIQVEDLNVRYRPSLPLSLRGLTFKIEGGSRVGIVGRTGCGKSTLVQSLLRLLEPECGQIVIDGVDISKLGLHKLRTSISVIPQSPVLYGGCSLRENLDPFRHHNDEQICESLLDVHMLDAIQSLSHGLDTIVAEGGSNFSTGQRQLLCLARAILRRNKILVLDEPTANVDSHTDKLLQQAVGKSFQGATILAVAHRLDTVIDYDRILVLGAGAVLEYGSPNELILSGGAFCSMVNDTGEEMASVLKARARENASK
jgi:ATP-binding cassette subfamily C (CFTR/MRP) protein 4